jgi:hypothetical protein
LLSRTTPTTRIIKLTKITKTTTKLSVIFVILVVFVMGRGPFHGLTNTTLTGDGTSTGVPTGVRPPVC